MADGRQRRDADASRLVGIFRVTADEDFFDADFALCVFAAPRGGFQALRSQIPDLFGKRHNTVEGLRHEGIALFDFE